MISREQIPSVLDHPVVDGTGSRIGEVKHVFLDDATGRPEWVSVRTGFFGSRESFVPVRDASLVEDHLEVPYTKDKIKDSPQVDIEGGGHLSASEEHRLYDYYGMDWGRTLDEQQAERDAQRGGVGDTDTAGRASAAAAGTAAGTAAGRRQGPSEALREMSEAREQGTRGTSETTETSSARDLGRADAERGFGADRGLDAMTLSEERLKVNVERHESGRARLRKYVVTEDVEQSVPLRHDEVFVEHEPITEANRGAALSGEPIKEDTHDVTLYEERAVVDTEVVPVERVRLRTEEHVENRTVKGRVRKERIETEGVTETGRSFETSSAEDKSEQRGRKGLKGMGT